jgi:hypothetical protein
MANNNGEERELVKETPKAKDPSKMASKFVTVENGRSVSIRSKTTTATLSAWYDLGTNTWTVISPNNKVKVV